MLSDSSVDALLFRLFEAPAGEWAQKLDELCAERPEHAEELRRRHGLLAATGLDGGTPDAWSTTVPDRLGDFRLLRQLGCGGMGMVFVAHQESLGRDVALKIVRPDLVFSGDARQRFRREIEAIASLEHPAIVPVLTHGRHGDVPFYVMPLVPGRSCDDAIRRLHGRNPGNLTANDLRRAITDGASDSDANGVFGGAYWQTCVRLVRQTALGLEHAHRRGIVHRDVKPSNVLLTPDGRALLVDFGLAHVRDDARITRTGAAPGSPAYMAPEQVRGSSADERSDVYSLAATLHHLLVLTPPFPIEDPALLRACILTGKRAPLDTRVVPRELAIVIAAAMDVDPDRRHASALGFADDLLAVLEHRPILARPLPASLRVHRWAQRHPTLATALGAMLLLVFGVPALLTIGIAGERDRARAAEDVASRHAYEASVAAASASLRIGDGDEAERRLDACPEPLRGFEWRHLRLSLSGSIVDFAGHSRAITALAIRDDGSEVAASDESGRIRVWKRAAPAKCIDLSMTSEATTVVAIEWTAADRLAVLREGPAGGELCVADVADDTVIARLDTRPEEHVCLGDGGSCVLVCDGFTVTELEPETLAVRRSISLAPIGAAPAPPFASDGTWLFAGSLRNAQVWRLSDGEGQIVHGDLHGLVTDVAAGNGRAAFATALGVFVAEVSPLRLRQIDTGLRPCSRVAMDRRGAFVVGLGVDDTVRTWDAKSSRMVSQTFGPRAPGRAVAVASQRLLAAAGDDRGALQLFSLFSGTERQHLEGHTGIVSQLAITPTGELLSAAHEPALRVWDPATGAPRAASYEAGHWINAMVVANDGDSVYCGWQNVVSRQRLPGLSPAGRLDLGSWVQQLLPLAGRRVLAVLAERLVVCDFASGDVQVVEDHPLRVTSAVTVARDAPVAFLARPGLVDRLLLSDPPRRDGSFAVEGRVAALAADALGKRVYCAEGAMLRCRRAADGVVEWERPCARAVTALLLLPDESRLVAGHEDGAVSLFEPSDSRCVALLQAGSSRVRAFAAPAGGEWLAAADEASTITLFHAGSCDRDPDQRLRRADVVAATWLDSELRRDLVLQSRVLAAISARADLGPELRFLTAAVEQLRPAVTWSDAANLLAFAMRPDQSIEFYERTLDVATATIDDLEFSRSAAAFANLRLGRLDDALRHCDAVLTLQAHRPELCTSARACRVLALVQLGRAAEAEGELPALRAVLSGETDPDQLAVLREAIRVARR